MKNEKYEFFWKADSPFSQWHFKDFTVDEVVFNTAEKWMMYQKALLFNDTETADKILATNDAREQKQLGREVKNYEQLIWDENKEQIVYEGNMHKFRQNPDILQILLSTHPKILVEASPDDKIWGIGLTEDDEKAQDESTWDGQNLLGYVLTSLREDLLLVYNSK